jgi:hypothetical protein
MGGGMIMFEGFTDMKKLHNDILKGFGSDAVTSCQPPAAEFWITFPDDDRLRVDDQLKAITVALKKQLDAARQEGYRRGFVDGHGVAVSVPLSGGAL